MEREPTRESNGKADKRPLYLRMYQDRAFIAIVRMIGYGGKQLADAQAEMRKLGDEFDKDKLVKAAEELVDIDAKGVRLKAHVRKPVTRARMEQSRSNATTRKSALAGEWDEAAIVCRQAVRAGPRRKRDVSPGE